MSEWIYFIHPPRDDFAANLTVEEQAAFTDHFEYLQSLLASGTLILAGPTQGSTNIGVVIFEEADRERAQAIVDADPVIAGSFARAELHPYRVALTRPPTAS